MRALGTVDVMAYLVGVLQAVAITTGVEGVNRKTVIISAFGNTLQATVDGVPTLLTASTSIAPKAFMFLATNQPPQKPSQPIEPNPIPIRILIPMLMFTHLLCHVYLFIYQTTLGSEADKLIVDQVTGSIQVESINGVKIDVTMDNLVMGVAVGVMSDLEGAYIRIHHRSSCFGLFVRSFSILV